jgi:SAM-dependent methyltransferase
MELDGYAVGRDIDSVVFTNTSPAYMNASEPRRAPGTEEQILSRPTGRSLDDVAPAPAIDSSGSTFAAEEDRIREAYARRLDRIVDDRYAVYLPGNVARLQEIERHALRLLCRHGREDLHSQSILEVGCGTGYWLRKFVEWGANPASLCGIDLLETRIAEARRLCAPGIHLYAGSAGRLDFASATFDLVCQFMMFSSILDSGLRQQIAAEMLRVLKAGGIILWYDSHFNNPRNRDVKGLKRAELRSLFPDCHIDVIRTTFLPPLARRLGWTSVMLYPLASAFGLLNSHYIAVIARNAAAVSRRPSSRKS